MTEQVDAAIAANREKYECAAGAYDEHRRERYPFGAMGPRCLLARAGRRKR